MSSRKNETKMGKDHDAATPMKFQEGLLALEQIVARLESGELALEDALRVFEQGVGLVRILNEKLTQAEQRIELLTRSDDGTLRLQVSEEEET
jgi:exodeoxyribonuclease VII small subunit